MNKQISYKNDQLFIESVAVSEITRSLRTPFYVYSRKIIKDNFDFQKKSCLDLIELNKIINKINNDFLKTEHKTELIFSPTPSVGQLWYDRVIPTIIKYKYKATIPIYIKNCVIIFTQLIIS